MSENTTREQATEEVNRFERERRSPGGRITGLKEIENLKKIIFKTNTAISCSYFGLVGLLNLLHELVLQLRGAAGTNRSITHDFKIKMMCSLFRAELLGQPQCGRSRGGGGEGFQYSRGTTAFQSVDQILFYAILEFQTE